MLRPCRLVPARPALRPWAHSRPWPQAGCEAAPPAQCAAPVFSPPTAAGPAAAHSRIINPSCPRVLPPLPPTPPPLLCPPPSPPLPFPQPPPPLPSPLPSLPLCPLPFSPCSGRWASGCPANNHSRSLPALLPSSSRFHGRGPTQTQGTAAPPLPAQDPPQHRVGGR